MKAVIYARYSSDNQREESIEGQIRECTALKQLCFSNSFIEKQSCFLSVSLAMTYFPI